MQAQEITIQAAESQDLPRLFEISSTVHATNYTELIPDSYKSDFFNYYELTLENRERYTQAVQKKMNDQGYVLFKAIDRDGTIVGYISGEKFEDSTFQIRSLFVDPAYQGRGAGTKLIDKIIKQYGDFQTWLLVIEGNRAAIALYKKYKFDFVKSDNKKIFYGARLLYMSREATRFL